MTTIYTSPVAMILRNTSEYVSMRVLDSAGAAIDATDIVLSVMDINECVLRRDGYPGPFTLTGTVSVAAGGTAVTGVGTRFTEELTAGDTVTIATEAHVLSSTASISDTVCTLATPHVAGASAVSATRPTRIVKVTGATGQYYLHYGDLAAPSNIPEQTETSTLGDVLFHWNVLGAAATERAHAIQVVQVVSAAVMRLVTYFRAQIDKAVKIVSVDPDDFCPLGYTDSDLLAYLLGGLNIINSHQPYPTWCQLETFPECFWQLLFDSAMVVGINAQSLFAIDSDVESYNDQGNSFVINHFPKLQQFTQALVTRLDTLIPKMKWHFVEAGVLHLEMGSSYRLNTVLSASPYGSTFRNIFTSGLS